MRRTRLQRSARVAAPIAPSADLVGQTRPTVGLVERALTVVGQRMRIIADPAARALTELDRQAGTTPTTAAERMPTTARARTTPTIAAERMPTIARAQTTPTTAPVQTMPIV